jgi:hypothetical protein
MTTDGRPRIIEGGGHGILGPDPEPLGERFAVLIARERSPVSARRPPIRKAPARGHKA